MLKILIPISLMLMIPLQLSTFMIIMSSTMMIIIINFTNTKMEILNYWSMTDNISSILMSLTMMSCILIYLSSYNLKLLNLTMTPIMLTLLMAFSSSKMLMFYIMFETVLIPTFFLITLSGKQPERMQAALYLLMYTITSSLPLLAGIMLWKMYPSFFMSNIICMKLNPALIFTMAFLVKFPMFMTHLWLPKAHVEAPLEGSMILAAILLKLGGYGIIRFLPYIFHTFKLMSPWIISISMVGAVATSMNCIRQKDMKSLIAYSSVAHMGLVLASIASLNLMGLTGAMTMMIAHAFSSSALFFIANLMYKNYHTRNISLFKGLNKTSPNLTFWWFMFLALNMSAPPSLMILSEVLIMSSLLTWNTMLVMTISLTSLMTATFSICMFVNMNHCYNNLNPANETQPKSYLNLMLHLIPSIMLISKTNIMTFHLSLKQWPVAS